MWIKANADWSVRGDTAAAACGGLFRDHFACFVVVLLVILSWLLFFMRNLWQLSLRRSYHIIRAG
ncbi:hypothetical protein A2U01_0048002 [Trifolium medium]|uniref:Uncharacterized protein n=1 Tax=Trifolium medium TaxID=97028 RepID=A0A392QU84_9FABA|nr:hypothetical protein [Trifolium medium]